MKAKYKEIKLHFEKSKAYLESASHTQVAEPSARKCIVSK